MDSFKVFNDDPALSDEDIKTFKYFSQLTNAPMVTNEMLDMIDKRLDRLEKANAQDHKWVVISALSALIAAIIGIIALVHQYY
jgi:hypothetical protein